MPRRTILPSVQVATSAATGSRVTNTVGILACTVKGLAEQRGAYVGKLLASKYRLEGCIDSCGMGEVYRGGHVTLRMPVAVKQLHRRIVVVPD